MQSKIFFSIIIPTYNRALFIEKTVSTALQQTYSDFEIIIVDDGSTDNTEEVVRELKNDKIKYYKIKNSERGAARNFGASMAKGDYFNFFDSDDVLYPNHLEVANRLILEKNNPEIIHTGYDVRNSDGKILSALVKFDENLNLRLVKQGNLLSCNGVFLRRDIQKAYPFIEDRNLSGSEDYELWLRIASVFPIYYSNTITSSIINHNDRSVLLMNKDKLILRFNTLVENLMKNKQFITKYKKYIKNILANNYSYISLHLALTGSNKRDSIKYLRKALAKRPQIIVSMRFLAIIKHVAFSSPTKKS